MSLGRKPLPIMERIRNNIDVTSGGCWEWQLSRDPAGYGRIWIGSRTDGTRRNALAHVVTYTELVGPVPDGLELDHVCRNRACCNPEHLEAVTHQENMLRGTAPAARNAVKTHCKYGHEFTEENTYRNRGKRYCRTCRRPEG